MINGFELTCRDIEKILAVWGYNGFARDRATGEYTGSYLVYVADKLANLDLYFPGWSYGNADNLIEKLVIANDNKEIVKLYSPGELYVVDATGSITGVLDGQTYQEIQNSVYDSVQDAVMLLFPSAPFVYNVRGTGEGTYGLTIDSTRSGAYAIFRAVDIPTSPDAIHRYTIDWQALFVGEEGVILEVDAEGDGIFERTIISDNKLTACKVAIELLGYELVSQDKVNETEFEYTFRVLANNSAKQDVKNITFKVVGEPNNTSVIDAIVYFSIIKAGEQILSDDTFKVRSDKSPDVLVRDLVWQICKCIQQSKSDFNRDWNVGLLDLAELADQWLQSCSDPTWCGGTDVDHSSTVDFTDFAIFADNWLWKIIAADFDIDADVDFDDYAVFAEQWAGQNCADSAWCDGADLNKNGEVEISDLAIFVEGWLEGSSP